MPLPSPRPDLLIGASLFLDFDGTLVEIADSPEAVVVGDRLPPLLAGLAQRLGQRVVVVSGRASADVQAQLGALDLMVAGSHGLERHGQPRFAADQWDAGLEQLRAMEGRHAGVMVEEKPFGAALHYRQAPHAEAACRDAAEQAAALTGLEVQPGKMVFELKPRTGNKGSAIRDIMTSPPFAGTRPVFVGDDLTDEHGFAAAVALGGAGVLVGEERPTAATHRLGTVAAVHAWLDQALKLLP